MQTVRGQNRTDIHSSGFRSQLPQPPDSSDRVKRLKISEFISWSVCFFVMAFLTGLMKFLQLAVTMESVISIIFWLSLAGLVYFVSRLVQISRTPTQGKESEVVHLN
jgi:hypothetical protein